MGVIIKIILFIYFVISDIVIPIEWNGSEFSTTELAEWVGDRGNGWTSEWDVSWRAGWGVWGRTEWVQCMAARRLLKDLPQFQLFRLLLCRSTTVRGDPTHTTQWKSLSLIAIVMVMFVFMLPFPAKASSSWLRPTANNRLYTIIKLQKRLNQKRMFVDGASVC